MTAKRRKNEWVPHERYDRSHPLLRELVFLHVAGDDGEWFSTLLTRVPGIGEEIIREDRTYKVLRVQHDRVDDDGRARFAYHAYIDAELQPEDEPAPRRQKSSKGPGESRKRGRARKAKPQPAKAAKAPLSDRPQTWS